MVQFWLPIITLTCPFTKGADGIALTVDTEMSVLIPQRNLSKIYISKQKCYILTLGLWQVEIFSPANQLPDYTPRL